MQAPKMVITDKQQTPTDRIRAFRELFLTMIWMGHRQMVQHLQNYDLTHPQFITLASMVAHGNPVSMRELCEVTFQDAPSMTRIVDRLVKMEWAQRTRHKQDRRVVLVEATTSGQALIEKIRQDREEQDALNFGAMSDEDLTKMETLLDHVLFIHLGHMGENGSDDIEAVKQELRGFAKDPISFVQTHRPVASAIGRK